MVALPPTRWRASGFFAELLLCRYREREAKPDDELPMHPPVLWAIFIQTRPLTRRVVERTRGVVRAVSAYRIKAPPQVELRGCPQPPRPPPKVPAGPPMPAYPAPPVPSTTKVPPDRSCTDEGVGRHPGVSCVSPRKKLMRRTSRPSSPWRPWKIARALAPLISCFSALAHVCGRRSVGGEPKACPSGRLTRGAFVGGASGKAPTVQKSGVAQNSARGPPDVPNVSYMLGSCLLFLGRTSAGGGIAKGPTCRARTLPKAPSCAAPPHIGRLIRSRSHLRR